MTTKTLRRLRASSTSELRKRGTRPLGETGMLMEQQPAEQLLMQIEKLLLETEKLSSRFSAISDVAIAINSSLSPEDILQVIVKKARNSLNFDYCGIGMLSSNERGYGMRSLVCPPNMDVSVRRYLKVTDGLPASVLASGKPLTVLDLSSHPIKLRLGPAQLAGLPHPELEGRLISAGIRSLLILPLSTGGKILGVFLFGSTKPNLYTPDDLQIAYLFSTMLATALHNSHLYDAETRRSHQLQMLSDIGQTATSILDPAALLARIPPMVQAHFGYDVAKIGLLQGDEVVYSKEAQAISGYMDPPEARIPVRRNNMPVGVVGLAAHMGQMVLIPNIFEDARWSDVAGSLTGPHIRSVLVIPMTARDRVLGVLHFESARTDAFRTADVSILQSLANQLGVALDNARLYTQLNELFHGYIAPQVASRLLDDPSNAQLGGQRRDVTVLFADLDGFTGLSERVPPEELIELLNTCLGIATEVIVEYGGTIDKYMGDAVMALWNAPQDQPDHAWRAVRAAIAMQRRLLSLPVTWEQGLHFAIGINSGEAVVGNIGSASLRNFTAIGDTVNLAKRIQEVAGPGQILINQSTYGSALENATQLQSNSDLTSGAADQHLIVAHQIGTKQLKGRTKLALLYEVNPHDQPANAENNFGI